MTNLYNTAPDNSNAERNPRRPRAVIEFIEGDLSKPIVYPNGGSYEADEAIRAEIIRRWARD